MVDQLGDTVEFVYEPFFWDRETFNDFYDNYNDKFLSIDSLSVEGLYWHQKLPLFINEKPTIYDLSYIKEIVTPKEGCSNLIVKSIRMNGRYKLFNYLKGENLKFVFLIRNPIDVVNSVINKFSFFGDNYHRSDQKRFFKEVEDIYNIHYDIGNLTMVEKSALYWKYMNLFALESFESSENKPYIVVLERYIKDGNIVAREICNFLGLKYFDKYDMLVKKKVGPVTDSINISKEEFMKLLPYLDDYLMILKRYGLYYDIRPSEILHKYQNFNNDSRNDLFYKNIVGNYLEKEVYCLGEKITCYQKQLKYLKDEISYLKERNVSLQDEVSYLKKRITSIYSSYTYKIGRIFTGPVEKMVVAARRVKDKIFPKR